MTKTDITALLGDLEKNETRAVAILTMIDGGFSTELIRQSVEELCDKSEGIKLKYSIHEHPYNILKINQQ